MERLVSSGRFGDWGALYTGFDVEGQPFRRRRSLTFGSRLSLSASPPLWNRDRHAERRGRLLSRQRITSFVRRWFGANGFVEVDPAALQPSPGNETHLIGFETALGRPTGSTSAAYLHTSPEFAMKKLLTAGETRIFALSHVFRNRERSALHAPEFAMLEWYRVGAPLTHLMDDCAALLALAAYVAGVKAFAYRGLEANPFEPPERLTVREAFLRHAGIDLYDSLSPTGVPDPAVLARQTQAAGLRVAADDTWSDMFSRLLSERVEPNLGVGRATILRDYPASEAALARVSPDDQRAAERFELYCCGVELANAFHELIDPEEQRRRFEADMAEQKRTYGFSHPIDEDFLSALADMPDASGAALGFDRLVMLATGANRVEAVQWTPVFDPEANI